MPYGAKELLENIFTEIGGKKFEIGTIASPKYLGVTEIGIDRIIYNEPATVVFWRDRTKTVVKCMEGEPFDKYAGFCAALAKKIYGSTSRAKKTVRARANV